MLRLLSLFGKLLGYFLVAPISRLRYWKQQWIAAPPVKIFHLSAIEVAAKIRKRELRSKEVVNAYIERIKTVNPVLNAVTEDRFEAALKEAEAADLIADRTLDDNELESKYPLLGVPFTVKEVIGMEGMQQSIGIKARKDRKSQGDGTAVKLLKEAGAIPLCLTNTPEWSVYLECDNNITGRTKNPYDTRRTPGGSSGGEAALIGSGSSIFGIGSDVAGSCRLPPLYCGIYGHKPTPLIIKTENFFPIPEEDPRVHKYSSVGIISRYASDLKPILQIIAGENAPQLGLNQTVELGQLNVYYAESFPYSPGMTLVDGEIKALVTKMVDFMQLKGATAQKLVEKIPNIDEAIEISMMRLTDLAMFNVMENENGGSSNLLLELLKSHVGLSNYSRAVCEFELMRRCRGFILPCKFKILEEKGNKMEKELVQLLDERSIIICPTFTDPAVYPNETPHKSTGVVYLVIANVFGLPATHVPLGFNKNGLPIGVQIIAGPNMDRLCLKVAKEIEQVFGGWIPSKRWT